MKASELMIGDWVFNAHHGENIQITPYDFFTHGHFEDGKYIPTGVTPSNGCDLDPIPITPEILKKNGFKKDDDGVWPKYVFVADIEKCPQTIITFSFYGKSVSAETLFRCWTKPKCCDGENNIHICDLKYVHELQHALRLCGIKKEIKI